MFDYRFRSTHPPFVLTSNRETLLDPIVECVESVHQFTAFNMEVVVRGAGKIVQVHKLFGVVSKLGTKNSKPHGLKHQYLLAIFLGVHLTLLDLEICFTDHGH